MAVGHLARRQLIVGMALAAGIGLLATCWGVFSPRVLQHYADSPDSIGIARWAEQATGDDMLRWWTGVWIQADSPYYRPLSSFLFWLEYQLFGLNFQGHVILSWLVHGAISVCVFLMALRLFPGPRRIAWGTSLLAVVLFNVRLTPEGPHWPVAPVAYSVVAWWPAQTDQMSLLFSMLALLALDRWLLREDPRGLVKAIALWLVALLFKEMAVIVPVLAALLAVYRDGLVALSRPGRDRRGLAWTIGLTGTAIVAAFLALRSVLVPGAWGIESRSAAYYLSKIVFLLASRPYVLLVSYGSWVPAAAVLCALGIYLWVRAPRRPGLIWLVLALLLISGLLAQLLGGNFALVTLPDQLGALGTLTLFVLGLLVLAHVRVAWPWLLLAMTLAVHAPLLWVWGPHYFYWPAAFWALFNAGLWHYVLLRAEEGTLRWRTLLPAGDEPASPPSP